MHYVTRSTAAGLSVFKGSGRARALLCARFARILHRADVRAPLRSAVLHVPHFARMANVPSDFSCRAHERNSLYAILVFLSPFSLLCANAATYFAARR